MDEIEMMKLTIMAEYQKEVHSEYRAESLRDYLLHKYAKIRICNKAQERKENKESANHGKKQCNIADVTNRTPNTKFKDNFMHPKDWNILQIAYAALLFQGAIVLFIKTILYILGYGW